MDNQSATDPVSPVMRKTAVFVVAGIGMLLLGTVAQPRFKSRNVQPEAERLLFPEFSDAGKAASLEILTYDDELATLQPFKVVQTGGVWVLPSQQNYPADAKDQLAVAATELIDRPILEVVSTSPGDHETYGVIEPDADKITPGMTGVGQLVEIRDAAGTKLARLIIGKEDKRPAGLEGGGRSLRFVRKAGQDPVYRVELDTSKFSSRFGDWIEKDLLQLSPWDVRKVILDDYTLGAVESNGRLMVEQQRKSRIDLSYDDKDGKWALDKLEVFGDDKKPKEEPLADTEELASAKLTDLRNALGDLKIIDVARKPSGLSADLKAADQFTSDPEAVASMQQRGFLPLKSGDILSTDGQTTVGMKDGVEYVLRFGAPTTAVEGQSDVGKKTDAEVDGGETSGRYLLVMARFNDALLGKPDLEPLPEVPQPDSSKDTKPDVIQSGEESGTTADKKEKEPTETQVEEATSEKSAGDGANGSADKPAAPKEDSAADALKKADEDEAKAQAAVEERRRVERENRRKQEEYDDKVEAAKKRVRELNARFADWYYGVSDAECAKIRLDRDAVVQKKATDDSK
ncbi:MAG: DUF4340 domain-containing protein [Planctomycetota bacterium]|nr:DUF4340 domain-containing protein [Planctomycetota bacterium]